MVVHKVLRKNPNTKPGSISVKINLTKLNKVTAWKPQFLAFGMSLWLPVSCFLLFHARLLDRQPLEGIAAVHGPRRECQLRAKEGSQNMDTEMLKSCFVQLMRKIFILNSLSIRPKKTHTIPHTVYIAKSCFKYVTKAPQVVARRRTAPTLKKKGLLD